MSFGDSTEFDPATLAAMHAAYDEACRILEIDGEDPRSSSLATAIATAARAG